MIVSFIWKDCNYQNGSWGAKPIDAFFVGFKPEEAKQHLPDKHFEEKHLSPPPDSPFMGKLGGRVYFLIGRDLSFCDLHAWWYPISGQWNGGSPFEAFGDIEISSLKELKKLKLRPEKKRQWTKAELIKLATDCKVKVTSRDTRATLLAKIKEAVTI